HHRQRAQDSGRAARPPVRQRDHTAPALGLRPGTGRSQIEGRHRMSVLVRIPTPLRSLTKGTAEVQGSGDTVGDIIQDLERQFPGLRDRLMDEGGDLRRVINIYVNEEDIRFLEGVKTTLKTGDSVSIVPAIAGGRSGSRAGPMRTEPP